MGKLQEVCKIGQGPNWCKYLLCGKDCFECAKKEGNQSLIDDNWNEHRVAQGNNCKDGLTKKELNE